MIPHMNYKAGGDVRIVMLTSCQSGCDFCHLEGHKHTNEVGQLNPALSGWKTRKGSLEHKLDNLFTKEDAMMAMLIAKNVGLHKMHLTGGEPTLSPHIEQIIELFTDNGFEVGITTHGEFSQEKISKLIDAGVRSINFSLHAINAEQYLAMDLIAQGIAIKNSKEAALQYAKRRIDQKLANIKFACEYAKQDRRIKVKANCVVRTATTAEQIVLWCNDQKVDIRLQRDLNDKEKSEVEISKVIKSLDAQAIRQDIAIGDSSGSGKEYRHKGGLFKVKSFGEVYVSEMCSACPLLGKKHCRERFYGLRIEHEKVTTCIDVQNQQTSFSFEEFLNKLSKNEGVPGEIREQYAAMRRFSEK